MSAKRKSGLHVTFNAPVTLIFAFLCVVFFALDAFWLKGKILEHALTCHGKIGSAVAFNFKNPFDYVRILTHVFGNTSWTELFINLAYILLLGPTLEERYGSPITALTMVMAALVTGVLNVCFFSATLTGSETIVLLMVLLASVASIDKGELPLTFFFVFILYCAYEMYSTVKSTPTYQKGFLSFLSINVPLFIDLAGGVCGSLFGFLVAPKKSRVNKRDIHEEDTISYKESAVRVPSSKTKHVSHEDETVIGELSDV